MKMFDSHAHYDDEAFDADREAILRGLEEKGVGTVVNIGASLKSSASTLELTQKYDFIYGTVGVHPSDSQELSDQGIQWLKQASAQEKILAIGEIGLDYYWDTPERDIQKQWFDRQLSLAREVNLPVVIHSRDAAKDTLDMIKGQRAGDMGGVIHCFSYGVDLAREYLNMGFYLGIGGVVTFQNSKTLKEVVAYMPMDRIVLETDSPYLAPVPHRGARNTSDHLTYVVDAIAQIKGTDVATVIETTERNGRSLYRMGE